MVIKPILFNTEMVRAILDGRKTVTRRVVKPQPVMDSDGMWQWKDCQWMDGGLGFPHSGIEDYAPYHPGDVLWVRETWQFIPCIDCNLERGCAETPAVFEDRDSIGEGCFVFRADWPEPDIRRVCWRPSIHMPKEAARLFLRVTEMQVERLQNVDASDAEKEGVPDCSEGQFAALWDTTIKPADLPRYGWTANPWVWVITFERCEKPAGWPGEAGRAEDESTKVY